MTQESIILLMAQPGHLRDSLQVLLAALSGSHLVILMSDWPVETLSAINSHPVLVLVILEAESPRTEVSAVVTQIKTRWPQTRMIALVDTEQQRKAITSAGVDRVWFKGTLASHMLVEIEALLNE
jgi:response regulator RpfG family c-di-GMP phosphodiesterase